MSVETRYFIALLAMARPHVKATADRTNTRTVYEDAVALLAEIDAALEITNKLKEKSDE